MREDWMFLDNGVGIQGKQRVGWIKKNLVGVTVTFWCLSIREPGKYSDTNMAKDFDRIHKSVRWSYTYDNTDLIMAHSANGQATRFSFLE